MPKYVQTNQAGYVTGIVEEPILLGLFGGSSATKPCEVTDQEAEAIRALLTAEQSRGEGLHISRLECLRPDASVSPEERRAREV